MGGMQRVLHGLASGVVSAIGLLPLPWVARLGRAGGELAWWLDRRHRRVALANLGECFGHALSESDRHAIGRENFRRIGETYACALKTARMSDASLAPHLEVVGAERIRPWRPDGGRQNRVVAIGHFGNFELYARMGRFVPGFRSATTYRGLRPESMDRLYQSLRQRSGCLFFERRRDGASLRSALSGAGLLLGLLADQHAGDGGLRIPFFGRECSTSVAPAVLALRYDAPLYTAVCYRTGLARWRIEVGGEIPTRLSGGAARPVAAIMTDVNAAFEAAVRRDPANWFWVHRRWKPAPPGSRRRMTGNGPAPSTGCLTPTGTPVAHGR